MDVWQMVRTDHANVEELCREVLKASDHGPNSRSELFDDLVDEMERLIAAKRHVLYSALADDERTQSYVDELTREHDEIQGRLDALDARPDKYSHDWAMRFKELMAVIRHAFTLEENGVMIAARGFFSPDENQQLRHQYQREMLAAYEAERWHLPKAMMPSRYGLPTGTVFGILSGLIAIGGAALAWRMSQGKHSSSSPSKPLRPAPRRPQPPFPLQSGVVDDSLGRSTRASWPSGSDGAARTSGASARSATTGGSSVSASSGASSQTSSGTSAGKKDENWFSSANPPHAPSGLSTPLQPGGTIPGGGPAASAGSIGTGGATTGGPDTGSLKRDGR